MKWGDHEVRFMNKKFPNVTFERFLVLLSRLNEKKQQKRIVRQEEIRNFDDSRSSDKSLDLVLMMHQHFLHSCVNIRSLPHLGIV